MTAAEVRNRFLQFFARHGHQVVPSSSLVPADDPTLLFTNAGMNQFKDVFLGTEQRSYSRATSVQKCVRAGGKHNDLDQVGRTARHQTFFEMLGNFSFGDYFKADAIQYAWTFVTQELGLSPDRIWVTIYRQDDEAFALWRDIAGLAPERIVRLGEKDNFWSMGDTGPCGPSSELFLDRGESFSCGTTCGIGLCDCDRFEEFWNLVFMQYNRSEDGTLTPLPNPSIDTGMGLERMVSILQGVPSNFETDLLWPLIQEVEQLTGLAYARDEAGIPFRVIADHVRTITMLLADGVQFANEGRGHVMRRILRRAVRYGRMLGLVDAFLYRLVPVVGQIMGDVYPEVRQGQETLMATVRLEEERFLATLETGLKQLDDVLAKATTKGVVSGLEAFMLYDTFGFPLDLTEDAARERGLTVDRVEFEAAMENQRLRARADRPGKGVDQSAFPPSTFVGYHQLEADSTLLEILVNGQSRPSARVGEHIVVALPVTPFYPEGGGQIGDRGTIVGATGSLAVEDVKKSNGTIWHWGQVTQGQFLKGEEVRARVDPTLRAGAMRNHTGTHLLHAALRQILGPGVRQTGSLVAPDRLRFDFSHPESMTVHQLQAVEDLVNTWILENRPVHTAEHSLEDAKAAGALAFFGEKYGEVVRVVEVSGASKELCGGTHCQQTGQIGSFRIVEETGVGSGIRRIEALTGFGALNFARQEHALLKQLGEEMKTAPAQLADRVRELQQRLAALERAQLSWQAERIRVMAEGLRPAIERVGSIRALAQVVEADGAEALRAIIDRLKPELDVAVLGSSTSGRVTLVAYCGPYAVRSGIQAGLLLKRVAPLVGGGGGGRADMAQAGGKQPSGLPDAMTLVKSIVADAVRKDIASSEAK